MSPFTLTLDTSWVVLSVTITMMDQLCPGAGTVCHVSGTRGVCSLLHHCNMSLVSSGARLIQHWQRNRVIQLKKSSNKQTRPERKWADVRSGCIYYGLLGCWWSRVYLVTLDQLLSPGSWQWGPTKTHLFLCLHQAPSQQRPAQGFHFTGQELSSDLFCDVSFRHENMNCNTILRTILSAGPCLGPDKIKYYQFEPSVKASYQYWKRNQIKHFVSLGALLLLCVQVKNRGETVKERNKSYWTQHSLFQLREYLRFDYPIF